MPWDDDRQADLETALLGALGVSKTLGLAVGVGKLGQIARAGKAVADTLMDDSDPFQRIAGSVLRGAATAAEDELAAFAAEHVADHVADRLEDHTVRAAGRAGPSASQRVHAAEAARAEAHHRRAQARPGGRVIDADFTVLGDEPRRPTPRRGRPAQNDRLAEARARVRARAQARRDADYYGDYADDYADEPSLLLPAPKKRR